ncbi:M48 family metalloprotease [Porticoccus sp.]|uniref:M48 family metalloprotease n=1 Tax=Porticoccus sp. TaxID=2024853 RepID=UPI003F695C90
MSRVAPLFFSTLLILVSLSGCSVNPVTGENQFSLMSAGQEVAIGTSNYKPSQQSQGGRYVIDPELQTYVSGVGKKLAAVSDRPDLPYEFVVLNNSVPNAWALPGGKIAINRGLLIQLEDESQLAAVLAHEIVHAAARHSAAQMTRGTLMGIGAAAVGVASANYGLGEMGSQMAQMGAAAWMARYGRSAELESDTYGMDYMARAGYDPYGAVKLQETFVKLSEGRQQDFLSGLFASHPPSQERVDANRIKAATLPKGVVNRDIYQLKIAQIKRDQPAYKAQEAAMKALSADNPKAALSELDRAIAIQPNDGYFWELRGHAWAMQENLANAEHAFTTAIGKNPDYFSHHLARGLLRYEQGKKTTARSDLEKSYTLLPTPYAGYYLGEITLESGDQKNAINYFQSAAQGGGEMGKKAQARLAVLELATAPHKYIISQLSLTNDGYLRITVKNNSPVTVTSVTLQVTEMVNAFIAGGSSTINGPRQLSPGQQVSLKTGIGPFKESEDAARYRVQVSSVEVAE